ncbi:MAG: HAD-IA family hydrolase [Sphingomonadales bacterium]
MIYKGVIFDLLTALLDSWSLWEEVAGSREVGLKWRQEYLKLTYSLIHYRPYEDVVMDATINAGLPLQFAIDLSLRWDQIKPWAETNEVLKNLCSHVPMAIATNCSQGMGQTAANILEVKIPHIISAEEAGFYKPNKKPYEMAIKKLCLPPQEILFVAGSASDVPGAMALGMDVYWHNKIGLELPKGILKPIEMASSLFPLEKYFS